MVIICKIIFISRSNTYELVRKIEFFINYFIILNLYIYKHMSEFTPIQTTFELLKYYCANGDIELLELVDFTDFRDHDIKKLLADVTNKINNTDKTKKKYLLMCKCIEFLENLLESDQLICWSTEKYSIYKECYYCDYTCKHKIQNKETNKIHIVGSEDIQKILQNENIKIAHFN